MKKALKFEFSGIAGSQSIINTTRFYHGFILSFILLVSCTTTANFRSFGLSEETLMAIDSTCISQIQTGTFPGLAIAVAKDNRKIWSKGYGYADVEKKEIVNSSEHLFRIGSISKTVTASALGRLKEDGKINLDIPIVHYFKDCPEDKKNITLRQLGGHQAGIRHYSGVEFFSNLHYQNVKDALPVFIYDSLLFSPGLKYSYTTYGWTLISAVMEDATGEVFPVIVGKEISEPLRLTDLKPDHIDSTHFKRVQFYELQQGRLVPSPKVDNSNKWAGGGFLCSAEDLAKFGWAHTVSGLLKEKTLLELTTPQQLSNGESTNYGIGFRTGEDAQGRKWYGHSGGSVGGTSMLLIYPEEKLAVVTLVNLGSAAMNDLAWKIADLIRKEK